MTIAAVVMELPDGWHSLPGRAAADGWVDAVVGDGLRPPGLVQKLRTDLERFSARTIQSDRHGVAVLDPDPNRASRVVAAGWVEVGPVVDAAEIADRLRAARLPGSVLARDVQLHESRRMPAVTCRDLMSDPADDRGAVLHERCAVIVVLPAVGVSVRLELSTSDLAAFHDIAAVCLEVARRVDVASAEGSVTT